MAGAAAASVLGRSAGAAGAAAAACRIGPSHGESPAKFPSCLQSAPPSFFPCRNGTKSALIPSCLSSVVPSCPPRTSTPLHGNCRASLLPASLSSSFPVSVSRPPNVDSGAGRIVGLVGGLNANFVKDLRRTTTRRIPTKTGMQLRSMAGQSEGALEELIQSKNSQNAVVVYSKTWCPYCSMVKGLFTKLGVPFEVVELDKLVDEQDVQDTLRRLTGQSTVPNVFIGGKHIGGCDDTMDLHKRGELVPKLEAAGLNVTAA